MPSITLPKKARVLSKHVFEISKSKLANANIIDVAKLPQNGIAVFGTTVHVLNIDTNAESTYQLVGDDEADIKLGKISINSPIARAIVGKRIGDTSTATTPSRGSPTRNYQD